MEQEIKINQEYMRIGSSTGEVFIPSLVTNEIVSFANGAQCSKEIFYKSFMLVDKTNTENQQQEHIIENQITEQSMIENSSIEQPVSMDLDNDEDLMKMFAGETTSNSLLDQLDDVVKHNAVIPPSRKSEPSVLYDVDENNNRTNMQVQHHDDTVLDGKTNIQAIKNVGDNEIVVKGFDIINEYEKVKLNDKAIKMTLNIEINLPDPTHIVVIREMYENNETDYLDYMVKKFIYDNVIANPKQIEDIFINEVNVWLDSKIKPKKKKTTKTKAVLKTVKKVDKPKKVTPKKVTAKTLTKKTLNNDDIINDIDEPIITKTRKLI